MIVHRSLEISTELYFVHKSGERERGETGLQTAFYYTKIDTDCLSGVTATARDLSGMLNESPVKEYFIV